MTKTVCFKVIYFGPHVSVSVRVFPTWSISCEMSAQTRCRRWPGPLLDVGPWQRAFVETKSRGGGGREERKNRRAGCDLCWCWLLTHSRRLSSLFAPHILPLVFQSSLFSCLSLSEALTLAFLAFTHTHTHTITPLWVECVSMDRRTADQFRWKRKWGEKAADNLWGHKWNQCSFFFQFIVQSRHWNCVLFTKTRIFQNRFTQTQSWTTTCLISTKPQQKFTEGTYLT